MSKVVAVFGASGQTGTTLVVQALLHGELSQVRALIRNPEKLKTNLAREAPQLKIDNNERLQIIEVKDVFDADAIAPHLDGVDVVVSTLGFGVERPSTNYFKSAKAIVDAMMKSESGPRRYIGMHSWYSEPSTRGKCPFWLRYTLLAYIAPVLDDMRNVERYVETETTDIDYTFVLPAGLQNKPVTDLEFKVAENSWCVEGAATMIGRADVARYIIKVIKEDLHKKKIVAIST